MAYEEQPLTWDKQPWYNKLAFVITLVLLVAGGCYLSAFIATHYFLQSPTVVYEVFYKVRF